MKCRDGTKRLRKTKHRNKNKSLGRLLGSGRLLGEEVNDEDDGDEDDNDDVDDGVLLVLRRIGRALGIGHTRDGHTVHDQRRICERGNNGEGLPNRLPVGRRPRRRRSCSGRRAPPSACPRSP